MSMDEGVRGDLIDAALAAQRHAYAPYSQFSVVAAVLTAGGDVFAGCNVENASFGLTLCAERAAVAAAVTGGPDQLEFMAIASSGGVSPCGACRQVLAEFNPEIPILLVNTSRNNAVVEVTLLDLFPKRFILPEKE